MKKRICRFVFAIPALFLLMNASRMEAEAAAGGTSFNDAITVTFGKEYQKSYSRWLSTGGSYVKETEYYDGVYYKFNVPFSGLVSFSGQTECSGDSDCWENVFLYNAKNSEVLPFYIDKGTTKNMYLTAGDYYLRFVGCGEVDHITTHKLILTYTDTKESFQESQSADNNTILKASKFDIGDSFIGQLGENDKIDCYRFELPSSGKVSVDISVNSRGIFYKLYNEKGDEMFHESKGNDAGADYLSFTHDLTKGVYYLSMETFVYNGFFNYGTYKIATDFESAKESFEEINSGTNNSVKTASEIKLDTEYTGQIAMNDRDDYYKVTVPSEGTLSISGKSNSLAGVEVALYSTDGTRLTSEYHNINDAGVNLFSIERECTAGIYYIDISDAKRGYTGNYIFSVKVKPILVSKIQLNKSGIELMAGKSESLSVEITPANASNKAVVWSSSDSSVASVDEKKGTITAKKRGTATITAAAADGSNISASCTVTVMVSDGWVIEDGKEYWYEKGVKQGTTGRGKEIYDAKSDAWYWLDAVQGGVKTFSKDVYQESDAGIFADNKDGTGKWVRYDAEGHMVKGWNEKDGNKYYFDSIYGAMVKSSIIIDGVNYNFNRVTGILVSQEEVSAANDLTGWLTIDGKDYWYENGVRQGVFGRGKEIFDPGSDAWYWLDAVDDGKKAVSKDVYQDSLAGDWGDTTNEKGEKVGKWVRYDQYGHMIKGWSADGKYYFDPVYGTMVKGDITIDGKTYSFDKNTGILK